MMTRMNSTKLEVSKLYQNSVWKLLKISLKLHLVKFNREVYGTYPWIAAQPNLQEKSSMLTKVFNCPRKTDKPCWGFHPKKNG